MERETEGPGAAPLVICARVDNPAAEPENSVVGTTTSLIPRNVRIPGNGPRCLIDT
jgi:hypothetical protein